MSVSLDVAQIFQIMEYVQSTLSLSVSCRLDSTRSGMYRVLDGCRVSQPWY